MNQLLHLSRDGASAFAHLTFPLLRPALLEDRGKPLVIAGVVADDEPVGLAFGMGGSEQWFELVSIYVAPFFRNQGIGTRLLETIEQGFAKDGYRRGAHFLTIWEDDHSLVLFLVRRRWSRPALRQIVCKTNLDLAYQTPWLVRARLPAGYRIISWHEVTADQRAAMARRNARENPWFPADVDPFHFEPDCHRETSVGLLKGDRVVGWVITHVLDRTTLRWTCSYVSDDLQGAGRILPLWWEVAQRQRARTDMERFIWTVPVTLPRMVRFARRRMRPWLLSLGYACTMAKDVTPNRGAGA